MKDNQLPSQISRDALLVEARALALTVATLRRARGKLNPEDCLLASPEWHVIIEEFARDVLHAVVGWDLVGLNDVDVFHRGDDDDWLGIGAAG
ncbi:hypothetical protein [Caballeronia sp. AZ7_KS35]|uniref:hypothetical protein n=1 Tax=Caballeronia sp. AZ7_KS35 TaxID=2921762 RepID=UPI002027B01F|nr:hypothetical protein [Caballeronia sp. AZ7_KS35]